MTYLATQLKSIPTGLSKVLYFHWALALTLVAVGSIGILMLYSAAGGTMTVWAGPQLTRFILGLSVMMIFAFVPLTFFRNISVIAYLLSLILLLIVAFFGEQGGGAQRWINLGFMRLQPSELTKITLVMILAWYYDVLPREKVSRPTCVFVPIAITMVPVAMVLRQPDLGTSLLLVMGGAIMMFLAGVAWQYFAVAISSCVALVTAVVYTRGTEFQLLKDYQYRRIETFIDPSSDPLGAGYQITQSKIALGSGGLTGRGYMEGTQSRLNFLPEKHTDFIFTTLAEEFGFIGGFSLLLLYCLIVLFCVSSALTNKNRFGALLTLGVGVTFFFYFAVNMSMVMGLAPVVGVPLPLVSYGGSAMLVLLAAFGLVQSAHIHRPR